MIRSRILSEPSTIPTMHPELFVRLFSAEFGEAKITCQACSNFFHPPTIPAGWAEVDDDGLLEYFCPDDVVRCRRG